MEEWGIAGAMVGLALWAIYERVRFGFEVADHEWTRWELAQARRDTKSALAAKDKAERS